MPAPSIPQSLLTACAAIPDAQLRAMRAFLDLALQTAMPCDEAKTAWQRLCAQIQASREAPTTPGEQPA